MRSLSCKFDANGSATRLGRQGPTRVQQTAPGEQEKLQNADQDEIGIDKRGLQQNKDDEAQDGKTAVEPVLDSPALNQRIFRLHSDA